MKRRKRPVPTIGVAYSGFGGVNVPVTKHYDSGSSTGGLAEAIGSLGGVDGDVYAYPHNHPIDSDYTVPSNIHLIVPKGTTFTIANGVTLTFNGSLEAGLYQIFSGAGAVVLGRVVEVYPEWWGAKGDDSNDDTAEINAAVASVAAIGGTVKLVGDKIYKTTDYIHVYGDTIFDACGAIIHNVAGSSPENNGFYCHPQSWGTAYAFNTGGMAKYDISITTTVAADAGNFAPGDYIIIRWGTSPYDPAERYAADVNIVRTANAGTGVIELEYPLAWDFAYVQNPEIRKLTHPFTGILRDVTVKGAVDCGVYVAGSLGSRLENVKSWDVGVYNTIVCESRSVVVENPIVLHTTRAVGSYGALITAWRNVDLKIVSPSHTCVYQQCPINIESHSRGVLINGGHLIAAENSVPYPFHIYGGSEDVVIQGLITQNFYQAGYIREASTVQLKNNRFIDIGNTNYPFAGGVTTLDIFGNYFNGYLPTGLAEFHFYKDNLTQGMATAMTPEVNINQMAQKGYIVGWRWDLVGTINVGTISIWPRIRAGGIKEIAVTGDGTEILDMTTGPPTFPSYAGAAGDVIDAWVYTSADLDPLTLDVRLTILVAYSSV